MAHEFPIHAQPMAAILGLINITRGPGALQQHHLTGSVKRESQTTGPVGRQQQIGRPSLKLIHRCLTLLRFLPTGEQGSTQTLLQQHEGRHKGAEQHHGFALRPQLLHETFSGRQLEFRGNQTQ